jgi:hypothetical protein
VNYTTSTSSQEEDSAAAAAAALRKDNEKNQEKDEDGDTDEAKTSKISSKIMHATASVYSYASAFPPHGSVPARLAKVHKMFLDLYNKGGGGDGNGTDDSVVPSSSSSSSSLAGPVGSAGLAAYVQTLTGKRR